MVSHSHDPLHLAISVESSLVSISLTLDGEVNKVRHAFNMSPDKIILPLFATITRLGDFSEMEE
jgi:hypothetical protein